MTENEFIKLNEEMYDNLEKYYNINEENGKLLTDFLTMIRSHNDDIYQSMLNELYALDPYLDTRNSMIQKITINRVLIQYLLFLSVNTGMDVNNALVSCNSNFKDDIWLHGVANNVMPVLLNNLDFSKDK